MLNKDGLNVILPFLMALGCAIYICNDTLSAWGGIVGMIIGVIALTLWVILNVA